MSNALDYARKMDVWWWSTTPEIKLSADFLTDKIWKKYPYRFDKNRLKNHLKVILTNLLVCHKHDTKLYLSFSLDRNNYILPERYRKIYFKYQYIKFIVDYLRDNGYIEFHQGINFGTYKRCARMRNTQKLLRLFRKYRKEDEGKTFRRTLPVFLRNSKKQEIKFDINQPDVKSYIQNTNRINKCLSRHSIIGEVSEFDLKEFLEHYKKYAGNDKYHRVFNNSSFEQGGRFYGHWSQNIPSKFRKYITIDGKRTVELDYSCLHISMLFGLEDMVPPRGDLYQLKGINRQFRPVIKKAVNIILNAATEAEACKAMYNEVINKLAPDEKAICPKPKQIIEAIRNTYPNLIKYFCTGQGVKLQYYDSLIAEKILLDFAKDDICCLTIHDSFIIAEEHRNRLEELMTNYFRESFRFNPNISSK